MEKNAAIHKVMLYSTLWDTYLGYLGYLGLMVKEYVGEDPQKILFGQSYNHYNISTYLHLHKKYWEKNSNIFT